jgi:glycosyltransferase involved in cell wall biosynthesis
MPVVWIAANTTWYAFNFRSELIRELRKQGFAVVVLSPADDYVDRIKQLGVRHVPFYLDNAGTNPLRDFILLARLTALLRRERPDVLLTYTPKVNIYGSLAARCAQVSSVANISGLGTGFIRGGWLAMLVRLLYRVALRYPEKVFFQNHDDRAQFVRERLVEPERTECVPGSGVDLRRFAPVARSDNATFVFLFVGRMLADKGIREYVEAARLIRSEFPATECHLLGTIDQGNPTAVSREQIRSWETEGTVRYLGSADDVRPYLAQADCVVLPSYREGCPRSLLEAAGMAIPLIASDTNGCRDVVSDSENGYLCQLRDAADLARQMRKMMALSRDELRQMGLAGREKMVREFDERIVISRYLKTVNEIVRQ